MIMELCGLEAGVVVVAVAVVVVVVAAFPPSVSDLAELDSGTFLHVEEEGGHSLGYCRPSVRSGLPSSCGVCACCCCCCRCIGGDA